jgi:hypothetical protein
MIAEVRRVLRGEPADVRRQLGRDHVAAQGVGEDEQQVPGLRGRALQRLQRVVEQTALGVVDALGHAPRQFPLAAGVHVHQPGAGHEGLGRGPLYTGRIWPRLVTGT